MDVKRNRVNEHKYEYRLKGLTESSFLEKRKEVRTKI